LKIPVNGMSRVLQITSTHGSDDDDGHQLAVN